MRVEGLPLIMTRSLMEALPKTLPRFPLGDGDGGVARSLPLPQTAPNQPMPTVAMLVTLAAADPAVERRRKEARRAQKGLDALEKLHDELLAGGPSAERLREIVDWAASAEIPDDPVLAAIVRDIDVRVRVELAKLDIEI